MKSTTCKAPAWHVEYVLRLADDALILGQRLAEWCGHGPELEEDLAMTNISLDLIGQARLLLSHAGALEGAGRDEDRLAYFRDVPQFRNHSLTELPNGAGRHDDYAVTVVRNLLHAARMVPLWQALAGSSDTDLAAIAAKSAKEALGHFRHARDWTERFGDGTDVSHERAQVAVDALWPYTHEFWDEDDTDRAAIAAGVGAPLAPIRAAWHAAIDATLAAATLRRPADTPFRSTGKRGLHTEHLGFVLAEMQSLARQHPDARW